ncbi:hypothetical protein NG798_27480 [Ancylothrix sp. C2]|uniref:hypothetical protein n=1 Tax=Ancylothrix sp. D3o TaxID=2953691 RepID=UPI0021BAEB0F|nr:hypothetical protein [Ancylothrix sp. D3o]MCT7953543.1 hypothetical protein [Ancylothrix sp. D3o]
MSILGYVAGRGWHFIRHQTAGRCVVVAISLIGPKSVVWSSGLCPVYSVGHFTLKSAIKCRP